MAFNNRSFDSFEFIPKVAVAVGIAVIVVALGFLLGDATYQLTRKTELVVAVIGCIVLMFAYVSWRIFKNV